MPLRLRARARSAPVPRSSCPTAASAGAAVATQSMHTLRSQLAGRCSPIGVEQVGHPRARVGDA